MQIITCAKRKYVFISALATIIVNLHKRKTILTMESLKEKTAKGLFWGALNSGTIQILNLVFGIVLAKQLTPGDYGIVGVLTIFTLIAGNLQSSGFTQGLTNIKDPMANDYNAVFWFNIIASSIIYTVLFFCAPLIAWFFHSPELTKLSRFVFLSFFISSFGIAHHAFMFKNIMAKERTITGLVALLSSGICGVILACNGMAYWSLAWQTVLFVLIQNLCRYWFTYRMWHPTFNIDFSPIRKMFSFSVKILITSIVNTVNNNVITFIIGHKFPMAAVGNFTQANKWNTMAYSTISGTIDQVAQPVLAQITDDNEREKRVFRKLMRFTAFLSFPAMFGLSLVSNEFILLTIGEKWQDCIPLLQVLCVGGAFFSFNTMYQQLAISCGRSDIYMWCNLSQIALQIVLILLTCRYGIYTMVVAYTIFTILWLGVWQWQAHRLIGLRLKEVAADILPFMAAAAAVMAATWFVTMAVSTYWILFLLRTAIAAVLYFIVMRAAHVEILDECIRFIRKKK